MKDQKKITRKPKTRCVYIGQTSYTAMN